MNYSLSVAIPLLVMTIPRDLIFHVEYYPSNTALAGSWGCLESRCLEWSDVLVAIISVTLRSFEQTKTIYYRIFSRMILIKFKTVWAWQPLLSRTLSRARASARFASVHTFFRFEGLGDSSNATVTLFELNGCWLFWHADWPVYSLSMALCNVYFILHFVWFVHFRRLFTVWLLNFSNGSLWITFSPIANYTANYYDITLDEVSLSGFWFFGLTERSICSQWVLWSCSCHWGSCRNGS
jgi:hypothetical protein